MDCGRTVRKVLARAVTHAVVGLDARRVEVEAHVRGSVPALSIVGLADRACQEAKERVRSGIASAERHWPGGRITVNLAPASLRKEGSGFDLPIALAILAASGQVSSDLLALHASLGELSLDGRVRPVGGALAVAEGARRSGLGRMLCAPQSAAEVALAGIEPVPVRHLAEAAGYLAGEVELQAWEPDGEEPHAPAPFAPDLTDVRALLPAYVGEVGRSSSRRLAATTCSSPGRPVQGSPCSPGACPGSCPRSRAARCSR